MVALGEAPQRVGARLERGGPGGVDLVDVRRARSVGSPASACEVGADAGAQLRAPVAVARRATAARTASQQHVDAVPVGLEEAGLLGGEQLVEGRARDAGGATTSATVVAA